MAEADGRARSARERHGLADPTEVRRGRVPDMAGDLPLTPECRRPRWSPPLGNGGQEPGVDWRRRPAEGRPELVSPGR
jgi:hypothetical protein